MPYGPSDIERQRLHNLRRPGELSPLAPNLLLLQTSPSRHPNPSLSLIQQEPPTERELITYVFPDFKAVSYFQKEFLSLNEFHVAEETEARGFEIYLVEQWIRDRRIGGVISAYTGNLESTVQVVRFTIVKKPSRHYPARFQEYLNEAMMNHATFKKMESRRRSSAFGQYQGEHISPEFLLVTNTAVLPSNLNLLHVPDGDTRAVDKIFKINSNLKRLNCGGRSYSLLASKVPDACEDKFRQMYRVHNESVPIEFAVEELVNIIQKCLFYFDLLDARYCDGMLCQKTEDAINNWWNLIGLPHFNSKQNTKNGILPSKTVAAIISLLLSIRLRLNLFGGCDVPKDPFDFENFMLSIGHFQKQVKLEKKRKLDLQTLLQLFQVTRQNYPMDSTKSFGDDPYYYEHNDLAQFDSSPSQARNGLQFSHGNHSNSIPASAYKRNKMYYSKELKKFTNVVKNTVQDHIIIREDDDDDFFDTNKTTSGGKIRKKIASKLGDNVSPSEIETLDLDLLVRKYLTGKTLLRLWKGLGSTHEHIKKHDPYAAGRGSRSHSRHSDQFALNSDIFYSEQNFKQYKVVTLRDALISSQDAMVPSVLGDKNTSGRLGKMRFAFQNRKSATPYKSNNGNLDPGSSNEGLPEDSLLDAELKKISAEPAPPQADGKSVKSSESREDRDIRRHLNRRNSFPMLVRGCELNLDTLEYLRSRDYSPKDNPLHSAPPQGLRRCISAPAIELLRTGAHELVSEEHACYNFVDEISRIVRLHYIKNGMSKEHNLSLKKRYKQINLELVKLNNVHTQMQQRQELFHTDYSTIFVARMRDITDNIDRMAFRSRDLLKKINELDENSKKFEFRLQLQSMKRLDDISHHLVVSNKFRKVFSDDEERQGLMYLLTGKTQLPEKEQNQQTGIRYIFMCIYEFIVVVLQIFNFDRSKMNLDRIRGVYRKIDPQRRYMNKAYNLVGKDSGSYVGSGTSSGVNGGG